MFIKSLQFQIIRRVSEHTVFLLLETRSVAPCEVPGKGMRTAKTLGACRSSEQSRNQYKKDFGQTKS
jgi:hypothetical protein